MSPAALMSLIIIAGVVVHCESHPGPLDQAERRQEIVGLASKDEPSSEGRENIMSFLTALEQSRKNASGRIRSQLARSRANGKRADKKGDTEVVEEFPDGTFPANNEKEMKDESLAPSPLKEKDPKKTKKQAGKKSNKRACFWKYCN
ncbi:urotensin II-related peptide [Pristis pectinata]|uniref:urotensin II-related peptide n=1 Tax=Pristis pectinata TaxID=685728 RepID=UPI00223E2A4E|nr:urotensin II-related peptide [Pristis pectinata]